MSSNIRNQQPGNPAGAFRTPWLFFLTAFRLAFIAVHTGVIASQLPFYGRPLTFSVRHLLPVSPLAPAETPLAPPYDAWASIGEPIPLEHGAVCTVFRRKEPVL